MPHLQIEIDDAKVGLKLTPIDLPISDALATALNDAIAVGDLGDSIPGDGELEENEHVKFPVRINLIFTKLNINIDEQVQLILRVKDDADTTNSVV